MPCSFFQRPLLLRTLIATFGPKEELAAVYERIKALEDQNELLQEEVDSINAHEAELGGYYQGASIRFEKMVCMSTEYEIFENCWKEIGN